MTDTPTREHPRTKRQLLEEARQVGVTGDWERALQLNDAFLERFPRDAEALNRKGRALLELGRYQESWDSYSEALNADPANMIARRNLQRLEMLANTEFIPATSDELVASPRAGVFIEEIGKTWVDELTHSADEPTLATVSPGEQLSFEVRGADVVVLSRSGRQLGQLEERIARRLIDLVNAGIRYEIYALGMSGHSLRFILREVYRDQSTETFGTLGLPRQNRAFTDLMRERELLSQREESDFSFGDDDEEAIDDAADEDDDADDEEEEAIDPDAAAYVDTSVTDDRDDEM